MTPGNGGMLEWLVSLSLKLTWTIKAHQKAFSPGMGNIFIFPHRATLTLIKYPKRHKLETFVTANWIWFSGLYWRKYTFTMLQLLSSLVLAITRTHLLQKSGESHVEKVCCSWWCETNVMLECITPNVRGNIWARGKSNDLCLCHRPYFAHVW